MPLYRAHRRAHRR